VAAELTLEPVPSAARVARHWVRRELTERSHPELTDSAVLAVSELVTNAVLHVRSTIVVRLVDDEGAVRVEVYDDSPRPPEGHDQPPLDDVPHAPSMIGRGLQIVDSVSQSWGVSYEHVGKCVWFLPAPDEGSAEPEAEAWPWDKDHVDDEGAEGRIVAVRLRDAPVKLFLGYRDRFFDLKREMTLIALGGRGNTIAHRLVALSRKLEAFQPSQDAAMRRVEQAAIEGFDRIDLTIEVPVALAPDILEFRQLLIRANEFSLEEMLLTLAAGPQEQALRSWYLGELAAQASGEAAVPWPGQFLVTDPEPAL
jgi:anti-sigma regulatory factor (Ser/Thr protein kinase)